MRWSNGPSPRREPLLRREAEAAICPVVGGTRHLETAGDFIPGVCGLDLPDQHRPVQSTDPALGSLRAVRRSRVERVAGGGDEDRTEQALTAIQPPPIVSTCPALARLWRGDV